MTFASRATLASLILAATACFSAPAHAAPCGEGGICPAGTHCEASAAPACPPCPSGSCPPCPPARSFCLADRIACASNADCPGYLVCTQTAFQVSCDGCPDPEPLPKKETHTCVFKERTCAAESDCADGLSCAASPYGVCSGGAGAEPTCAPVDENLCQFQPIGCTTTADCPFDFVCDYVSLACNSEGGICPLSTSRYCRPRGVAFSVTPDGKAAYSDVISSSHEDPQAADGRGNTASVANAKAARDGGSSSGPPAVDPGCTLSGSAAAESADAPLRVGLVGLLALFLRRVRPRASLKR